MTVLAEPRQISGLPVIQHPNVVSGAPVFKGTRVRVATLFEYLADDYTLDEFLESFPSVKRADAIRVIMFGREKIQQEFGL